MAQFKLTAPGGEQFNVEADSPEAASKQLNSFLQEEANTKAQAEYTETPGWAKPFVAATDVARTAMDTASAGFIDKGIGYLTGQDEGMQTKAIRSRMGGADIATDVATAAAAIPTAVPKLVAKVGGGPIVRGVTGLLGAGAEGGAYGAASAVGHDQPVTEGAVTGAGAGILGQAIAAPVAAGVNRVAKAVTGASDTLGSPAPTNVLTRITKATSPVKKVETAVARAENAGGRPGDYKEQFRDLNRTGFGAEEKALMDDIVKGDFGTRAAKQTARAAHGYLGSMVSAGSGLTMTPAGLAAAAAIPSIGYVASHAARQGTEASVEALRRSVLGKPKYQGILSAKDRGKLGVGARTGILDYTEE